MKQIQIIDIESNLIISTIKLDEIIDMTLSMYEDSTFLTVKLPWISDTCLLKDMRSLIHEEWGELPDGSENINPGEMSPLLNCEYWITSGIILRDGDYCEEYYDFDIQLTDKSVKIVIK